MSSLPFGIIDICFVAILVISGILAYIRGFVREVLSVAAWVGATFVTLYGYPHLQPIAREHIENRMLADGVYVIPFSFPVVPRGKARIRVQLSAAHSEDDVRRCVDAFKAARDAVS